MARPRKEASPEESPGAPAWMITYSDCMNLLLTFFVLLVTFSSYGDDHRQAMLAIGAAIRTTFGQTFEPTTKTGGGQDQSSIVAQHQIQLAAQPEYGSDKFTGEMPAQESEGVLRDEVQTADYYKHKVFRIASHRVFWGKGVLLSAEGRYLLAVMAAFLKEVPGPVVLSESGPDREGADLEMGLSRAWAALEFFVQAQNLAPERFRVSGHTMSLEDTRGPAERGPQNGRMLEIVLLDRSESR